MIQTDDSRSESSMVEGYKQGFQEEAREILIELESTLLELNENHNDSELVGRAFRALHTIKGSGSMFGFERLVAFTHNLESAFEEIRTGNLAVTSEIIDLSLSALDQMKSMLDEEVGRGAADDGKKEDILSRLQILMRPTGVSSAAAAQPAMPALAGPEEETHQWRIRLVPGRDLMRNGSDPRLLLVDLRQLGSLHVEADMSRVPPLDELDPERCYVCWDTVLTTSATVESIRDVFIFVEDCCELTIERMEDAPIGVIEVAPQAMGEEASSAGQRRNEHEASIRVPAAKLDQLMNLVGELVTVQACGRNRHEVRQPGRGSRGGRDRSSDIGTA